MASVNDRLREVGGGPVEWSKPVIITPDGTDEYIGSLLDAGSIRSVHDRMELIQKGMLEARIITSADEAEARTRWVYFPWDESVVRYPDEQAYHVLRTYRNRPLITPEEQEKVRQARLAFIGLSVGSKIVQQLVESGTGNNYFLTDPDIIEFTNLNRMNATTEDIGESKLSFVAKKVSKKDPFVEQAHEYDGYSRDAQERLGKVNVLVEEADDIAVKAMVRLHAAEQGIPVVMITDLGEKSVIDIERYDIDEKTKPFNGALDSSFVKDLADGNEISEKERMKAIIRITGGLRTIPPRVVRSAAEIRRGNIGGLPQLGRTATAGGVYADLAIQDILIGRHVASGRHVVDHRRVTGLKKSDTIAEIAKIYHGFVRS